MRVLVVDDELTNRRLCQRMLQRLNCECVCLEDGDEIMGALAVSGYAFADGSGGAGDASSGAPAAGELNPYHIVLLDIMMRRTNGVDVLVDLKKLFERANAPLPPVIAMTGNTSLQVQRVGGGACEMPAPSSHPTLHKHSAASAHPRCLFVALVPRT